MLETTDRLPFDEAVRGPVAAVRVLPVGGCDRVAPRWIEVRAREYTFRLAYDAQADSVRSGTGSAVALAGYMAQQLIGAELTACVVGVFVDGRGALLGFSHVARGTGNTVLVKATDLIHPALLLGARGVVIAHNHPTGDPTPSRADRTQAEALRASLELVEVRLLASLVVTVGGWRSVWEATDVPITNSCDRREGDGDA